MRTLGVESGLSVGHYPAKLRIGVVQVAECESHTNSHSRVAFHPPMIFADWLISKHLFTNTRHLIRI